MKRAIPLFVIILLLLSEVVVAQTHTVFGGVTDPNGFAVEGVYVTCQKGDKTIGARTDINGKYRLDVALNDSVVLKFSHLNYKDTSICVRMKEIVLPINVSLKKESKNLNAVRVSAKSPNGTLKGDTTVYYATAYKTNQDATAYDLIQKLPGVGVTDGTVQAHGEAVSEVLIDGKEYSDITMALKNLPAYIVNEVQVFYKESDYSRMTGFDDGNRKLILNFSTKHPDDEKLMSRVQLGYGSEKHYDCYGNLHWFKDRHLLSLFAQFNNVNKQDFSNLSLTGKSSENTPGVSPYAKGRTSGGDALENNNDEKNNLSDGITTTKAVGLNYSFQPHDSSISATIHYFFSDNDNELQYTINDYFFVDSVVEKQHQQSECQTMSHHLKSKIEWNITPRDVVVFRPEISLQRSTKNESVNVIRTGQHSPVEQTGIDDEKALVGMGTLTYIHRLGKRGAAMSLDFKGGHMLNNGETEMNIVNADTGNVINRTIDNQTNNTQLDGVFSFVTPSINRYSRFKIDVGLGMKKRQTDRLTEQGSITEYTLIDSMSSGGVVSDDKSLTGRMIYMYSRHKLNLVGGIELNNTGQEISSGRIARDTSYCSLLPFVQLRYDLNAKNQIHVNMVSKQQLPAINMLQEAASTINPTLCIVGNAMLTPAYSHDVSARWLRNDVSLSQFMVLFLKYGRIDNYIATVRAMDEKKQGVQMVSYRNSNTPQQSIEALAAYGFPISFIKSNGNVSSFCRLSDVPGFLGVDFTKSRVVCWNNSFTIGSNVSERLDFVVDMNLSYNSDKNNYSSDYSVDYWSYSCGGQIVSRIGKWIKCTFECGYTGYSGEKVSKFNAVICNAAISSIFGKNDCFEMQFYMNDIFNQNNNFYQSTSELYLRESESNVLKRYAMLKLIYKIK